MSWLRISTNLRMGWLRHGSVLNIELPLFREVHFAPILERAFLVKSASKVIFLVKSSNFDMYFFFFWIFLDMDHNFKDVIINE